MTWLFPIIAPLLGSQERKKSTESASTWPPSKLELLIPAHNEEHSIGATLPSLLLQIAEAQRTFPAIQISVRVGADACSDGTAKIVRAVGAGVIEYPHHHSKWKTLQALVQSSEADWVALVDAEIQWPERLLTQFLELPLGSQVLGIAPSFGNSFTWKLERSLKLFENRSGGPVSVHGATVFYSRSALITAFDRLSTASWLNDDVVLPLMLRTHFPASELLYWIPHSPTAVDGVVTERKRQKHSPETPATEFRRRVRMLTGNLQWIQEILPLTFQSNPQAGMLAMRRVFRVFWAYWLLVAVMSVAMRTPLDPATLAVIGLLGYLISWVVASARIGAAFTASLLAPYLAVRMRLGREIAWR